MEQNANLALKIAHRGYVMETGSITMTDTGENLLTNEAVKKAYLGYNSHVGLPTLSYKPTWLYATSHNEKSNSKYFSTLGGILYEKAKQVPGDLVNS